MAWELGSKGRESHLQAHGGNLDEIIERIFAAEKRLQHRESRPPAQPDPERVAIAEQKIRELRREKRLREIKSLSKHKVAGLRAVETGRTEKTDGFTLDMLGRMKLLARPKGSKGKAAWQLTEDGRLALEIHKDDPVLD